MKNEMNKIPTPETIFRYEADKYTSGFSAYGNMRDHARDLERRLTIARESLMAIADKSVNLDHAERVADRALKLTARKP